MRDSFALSLAVSRWAIRRTRAEDRSSSLLLMRAKKTLALIQISGEDYSSINFPDEFALDGEPLHLPAAIDSQIGLG